MLRPLLFVLVLSSLACSAVRNTYLLRNYDANANDAIKNIEVVAWAPPEYPKLAPLMARIAADLIKLHKNYLVHADGAMTLGFVDICQSRQGVLVTRAMDVEIGQPEVKLDVLAELYRCEDGALVWQARGDKSVDPALADLQNLTTTYSREFAPEGQQFAAPVFALLKQLLDVLPDVTLNDDEILQKIELGNRIENSVEVAQLRR